MTTAGIEWTERQMIPMNIWKRTIPRWKVEELFQDAVYALAAEAYKAEFLCEMEPMYAILRKVACACGGDRETGSAAQACEGLYTTVSKTPVAKQTVFIASNDDEEKTVTSPAGSIRITSGNIKKSVVRGGDNVGIELMYTSPYEVLTVSQPPGRRVSTKDCSQFEIVRNTKGEVVGQLIGGGLTVKGLTSGEGMLCVPADLEIPRCAIRYTAYDFALGNQDAGVDRPMEISVTTNKADQICGQVPMGATSKDETMVWPIVRTRSLGAYVAYQGEVVKATMKLNLRSKDEFSGDMMQAFKASVAAAIKVDGLGADDIVITKVCDGTGCTDYGSRRALASRRAEDVTVEYEIQAGNVSPDQIKAAVSDPLFTSSFEQVMLEQHNYPIIASCVDCEQLKVEEEEKEQEKKEGGIISNISDALEEATGLSSGAIAGIAVGAAAGLGAIAAAAYTFSRKKTAPTAGAPSSVPPAWSPAAAPSSAPSLWSPSGDLHGTSSAVAATMEAGGAGEGGTGVDGWRNSENPVVALSSPSVQPRFCIGCGAPIVVGAAFCGACGRTAQ